MNRWLLLLLLCRAWSASGQSIITEARSAAAQRNFALGESRIEAYRSRQGVTPEMLVALSWLARGAFDAREFDNADTYAEQTRTLAVQQLKGRNLDADTQLPLALGAAIEVHARVMDARNQRGEAVSFLRRELETYRDTSILTRIQKNIHVLSLEGKPAPPLRIDQWINSKPVELPRLKGHPVLLFFWAHWCSDCKHQSPDLARIAKQYAPKGLRLVGPTQLYGYAARGEDAAPGQEMQYIEQIRTQFYSELGDMAVPVSEENFKNYGASTTPTLVLVDRLGIVRLYHPGVMTYEELEKAITALNL